MSKKQLIKDNLLLLIGGNLGNVFSFVLNIVLLRSNAELANEYIAYNSIALILGVPSIVAIRTFTIYGDSVIAKLRVYYENNKNRATIIVFSMLLLMLPITYLVKLATERGTLTTSALIVLLAFATVITYAFRGLKQSQEDFLRPVISLNIETLGRLLLGYALGVVLGLGIYGVMVAAILTMLLAIIPCFDFKFFTSPAAPVSDYKLKRVVLNSFLLTSGTEFFANFDIAYSLRALHTNVLEQTEYSILQIFRKVIFYGIFIASSLVLSIGSKEKHTKKFSFFYTLVSGLVMGIGAALGCYIFKDILLAILNKSFTIITNEMLILFLVISALMSASYLLSNWLLSLKKNKYVLVPILASIIQFLIFIFADKDLINLLNAFTYSSVIYFLLVVLTGIYEVFLSKKKNG
jgi:hypothetical protein